MVKRHESLIKSNQIIHCCPMIVVILTMLNVYSTTVHAVITLMRLGHAGPVREAR